MTSNTSVIVTITADTKPGKEQDAENLLKSLIAPSRQEHGCLQYELHRSKDQPNRFFMYQVWSDEAALEAHIQADHIKKATPLLNEYGTKPFERMIWNKY